MENDLSRAVVLFLGAGVSSFPAINPARLIQEFGDARGVELGVEVAAFLDELGRIEVDWTVHNLQSATEMAEQRMAARHANLTDEAIKALGWKFSFGWR